MSEPDLTAKRFLAYAKESHQTVQALFPGEVDKRLDSSIRLIELEQSRAQQAEPTREISHLEAGMRLLIALKSEGNLTPADKLMLFAAIYHRYLRQATA